MHYDIRDLEQYHVPSHLLDPGQTNRLPCAQIETATLHALHLIGHAMRQGQKPLQQELRTRLPCIFRCCSAVSTASSA